MPSSVIAPEDRTASEPSSCLASTIATMSASWASSNSSPLRAAWPRRTIDITPAICLGPMTAISAVIFLVSARYDMATSYIIGRVENNDYGLAIAYSTALIFVMLAAVGLLQLMVGRTRIGRRMSHEQGGG